MIGPWRSCSAWLSRGHPTSVVRTYLLREDRERTRAFLGELRIFPNWELRLPDPPSWPFLGRSVLACPNLEAGGPDHRCRLLASPSLGRVLSAELSMSAAKRIQRIVYRRRSPLASTGCNSLRVGACISPLDHATQTVVVVINGDLVLDTAADPPGARPIQRHFAGWAACRQSGHLASTED